MMESFGKDVAREFSVIVSARNGQMSNYAILSISLLDDNDNPPKFLQSEYSAKLLARYGFILFLVFPGLSSYFGSVDGPFPLPHPSEDWRSTMIMGEEIRGDFEWATLKL